MFIAFALGLALGAGLVVFGRDTRPGRAALIWLHVQRARVRRWRNRR